MGTLARQYVRLDHINWHKVPGKDELWNFVKQKYSISEAGKPWMMRTMSDAWRVYKSRIKKSYYKAYDNNNDRRKNRPNFLPDKEFETLLQFWNDAKVEKLAAKNSTNRKLIKDQHTCGQIGFARIRKKLARLEEKLLTGGEKTETIVEILGEASSHGRSWLVGRIGHIKKRKETPESSGSMSKKNISDETIDQIKTVVREEMRNEVREEMRNELKSEVGDEMKKTMEAQVATIIQRLAQMNPSLNLNLDGVVDSPNTIDFSPSNAC
ncbi:uncharacterized protein [Euphorbia lathyris]|uniref:uncharacterized protein n=1 Tax=Euphorbia lathyris TaxID=212925 RepID=UPI003313297D